MVASVELVGLDFSMHPMGRFSVGLKLVRIWAALRPDDLQDITPGLLELLPSGLTDCVDRPKTSGLGRQDRWLLLYASADCFVARRERLEE
eukprot:9847351-Karenia_brevis.AAC.1